MLEVVGTQSWEFRYHNKDLLHCDFRAVCRTEAFKLFYHAKPSLRNVLRIKTN